VRCESGPSLPPFENLTPAVIRASAPVVIVDESLIDTVVSRASQAPKGRARVLLHLSQDDSLHEMVIALPRDSCDVPHINFKSGKSFHLVRGEMVVMLFSDDGQTVTPIRLGGNTGRKMVRLNQPCWHTIIPITEHTVFIETIIGPFAGNRFAEWSPRPEDAAPWSSFVSALRDFAALAG
jgi:cupin fold WbuC family metalloprotein